MSNNGWIILGRGMLIFLGLCTLVFQIFIFALGTLNKPDNGSAAGDGIDVFLHAFTLVICLWFTVCQTRMFARSIRSCETNPKNSEEP